MTNEGEPAFPVIKTSLEDEYGNDITDVYSCGGMTLRDYFAGKMLEGLSRHLDPTGEEGPIWNADGVALRCYEMADAMLKARTT